MTPVQAPAAQGHSAAPFSMRRIGNTDHGNNDADIYEVVSAKGRVLVPSVRKCDAMLFRAAPDLLAALRMALNDSEIMAPDGRPMCVSPETLQRMRAALSRATGSEQ